MSNYTKITDFAAKDPLLHGNPSKVVTGTGLGAEFDAIAAAVATKVDINGALGTPSSGVATNLTGTAAGLTAGNATNATNATSAPTLANNLVRATDLQAQAVTAFTTGGTATAFTLTPAPAITANAANQRFRVKFHAAAGATPTLAVSGLTALNLKYKDSAGTKQAITSTQVPSGWISDVENDGTDWVVLDVPPSAAASETVAGLLEIATAAEAQSFTANKAIDGAKLAAAMQGANQSLAVPGYQKLPGGLIIQWGRDPAGTITFPIAFPSVCLVVNATAFDNTNVRVVATATVINATTFLLGTYDTNPTAVRTGHTCSWIAIGY